MNDYPPIKSWSQRVWSWVLGALVLVVLLNVIWTLLLGIWPFAVLLVVAGLGLTGWQRHRWR
jgi:hypothetical protein